MLSTARKLHSPIEAFSLSVEEYQLLNHLSDHPKRWNGYTPDAVDYLMRRSLVRACSRGRILAITLAGKGTVEAIGLLMCS